MEYDELDATLRRWYGYYRATASDRIQKKAMDNEFKRAMDYLYEMHVAQDSLEHLRDIIKTGKVNALEIE